MDDYFKCISLLCVMYNAVFNIFALSFVGVCWIPNFVLQFSAHLFGNYFRGIKGRVNSTCKLFIRVKLFSYGEESMEIKK